VRLRKSDPEAAYTMTAVVLGRKQSLKRLMSVSGPKADVAVNGSESRIGFAGSLH
jgi:hypothetical protein